MSDPARILGAMQTRPAAAVPPGACDCHAHVFGPPAAYPLDPGRPYTPGEAPLEALLALHAVLGVQRVVVVHPSPYGTDNRCTVDALRALGPDRGRGVAVIDEAADEAALRALHAEGVRGARVNLETVGLTDPATAWALIERTSRRVAPLGWHVQVHAGLALIAALADRLARLPCLLVIDHFGRARAEAGPRQPGFDALLRLLGGGRAFVKLSAPHRVSSQPGCADLAPIARALIAANPDGLVWATDWPHPDTSAAATRRADGIEPFRGEDDGAALDRLAGWAGDAGTLRRILVDNPARLYGFADTPA